MCVIFACESKVPDEKKLFDSEECNPHGAGISWQEGNGVRWIKGLSTKEIIKTLSHKSVKLPLTIHYRWASIGGQAKELCHPFPVNDSADVDLEGHSDFTLMHNGHWSNWDDAYFWSTISQGKKFLTGPVSDSRALASMTYRHGFEFLDMIPGSWGKAAILGKEGMWIYGTGWLDEKSTPGFRQSSSVLVKRVGTKACGVDSSKYAYTGFPPQEESMEEMRKRYGWGAE